MRKLSAAFLALFTVGLLALAPAALCARALAQDEAGDDSEDPGESRAAAFEAADGAQTENIPGGALMVAAYGVIFLLVLGYVISIGYRQAQIGADVARLQRDLESKDPPREGEPRLAREK
jgi:hypothetical protein